MFRRREKAPPAQDAPPAPAEVFLGLRSQVMNLDPDEIGLGPATGSSGAWGCLVETGYPHGTASLVCLRDGTTSLYTSSGFGIIGGGGHDAVRHENARLLAVLGEHLPEMTPSTDQSLPLEGRTVIRALTTDGPRLFEESERVLGEGRSALSPVFHAAHAVITQLRLIEQQGR
ncbi:hypothetical protein [Oryzihumus leptocrescens]|uniref:Uncharacterized protein n=1 Tax=Oryzihumus leptocrescens TaxID=297536 RepID=A0A542ZI72_9MICO|nr:hypothetical protein [Oryzihumus leptocrescens]TQL60035.1 hypothetical protein FB474_1411 [Oryzihumus leptocrescens]